MQTDSPVVTRFTVMVIVNYISVGESSFVDAFKELTICFFLACFALQKYIAH